MEGQRLGGAMLESIAQDMDRARLRTNSTLMYNRGSQAAWLTSTATICLHNQMPQVRVAQLPSLRLQKAPQVVHPAGASTRSYKWTLPSQGLLFGGIRAFPS